MSFTPTISATLPNSPQVLAGLEAPLSSRVPPTDGSRQTWLFPAQLLGERRQGKRPDWIFALNMKDFCPPRFNLRLSD